MESRFRNESATDLHRHGSPDGGMLVKEAVEDAFVQLGHQLLLDR
jgi:hypothetical protein